MRLCEGRADLAITPTPFEDSGRATLAVLKLAGYLRNHPSPTHHSPRVSKPNQAEYLVFSEPLPPVEKGQLDQKRAAGHDPAGFLDQLAARFHRSACREKVVDQQHALAG